mgnify:CR=1 FL=1
MIDQVKKLQEELMWAYYENKITKMEYDEQIKHISESVCINNKEKEEK